MTKEQASKAPIQSPSAQPATPNAKIFGVQTTTEDGERRVGYLTEPLPVTDDLLAVAGPAKPTEVFRIASPCMGSDCKHFDGANCRLATRVATMLDPVVSGLPPCAIRPTCRWFRQEGKAACLRCPQMVTDLREATEFQRSVAGV
jgi:hypothetical protein